MYTLYKFHFVNGISEINQLCIYIYIYIRAVNRLKYLIVINRMIVMS